MKALMLSLFLYIVIALIFYVANQKTETYDSFDLPPTRTHPLAFGRESVTLSDDNFTYHLNLSKYEEEFPALQSYRCSLVIDKEDFCRSANEKLLFILSTKSHPSSFHRRVALRKTWAKEREISRYLVKPLFLMATSPNQQHMNLVEEEDKEFKDILLWDFMESHSNLSLKEQCFIQWLFHNCRQVEFIFKGDDDEFVNPEALVKYIGEAANASHVIHGFLHHHSTAMRHGKYKISYSLFPNLKYPSFLSGGGFLFPGIHVPALYAATMRIPIFPLDDVYFGFLTLEAGLKFHNDERFYVWGLKYNICLYKKALVVHGISQDKLLQVWQELQQTKC
ncbi:N-acetyllactosaminide beta-1,3-N-acetylglucosaminyltransferase 2-like [Rhinatrema bivittatum]|uniref:N-acetyllactosaminide beta-1,3-N-acetylglucosaminyltransferase 2-like n=1 Tax=Rhinatrema bivittatum TaxID=194408 RepID=UPI001128FF74|nr:N-acetyllactosaminide beta-1,3-N-acetylglucosaminyltransferase 2-like [Rhinatrema bivittatum]XP_029437016.1 N-acetyllactosaminide beta-1,3-N-acetylglucosaminyltransferase 2-like [Rhinatrema bivittatum]XP_029437017.1 N-acetyllactosaminide beta-1,3-N-acetylglucosaminyltransferase 2-like [Rhinatrema bivittatum]XP_029437018.1 N-acetyllactosaminide beta-1,3-N-acetylglucosaminyltransferase 2-like [Rhinatrema bivittatum]XP_029437019.1 N-acetyllactosaminide beta-1,3-N-acetylglucosaminyltransferase 2